MDNKLRIVNYLGKNKSESYSMHELSKQIHMPYATLFRTLREMEDILLVKRVGKAKTVMLNIRHPALKSYLIISSEEEKKEYLEKQPILKKITKELETKSIVLLFGSYAKGTERKESDIDLLIINKEGKKETSFLKYETLFRIKINPLFITQKEFKETLHDTEENVGKQALKYHILLNNAEKFWELIFQR